METKMRKTRILAFLAAAAMMASAMPCAASAEEILKTESVSAVQAVVETEDFSYQKYSDHVEIVKGGSKAAVTIPAEVDGLPVTVIARGAFSGNTDVTQVILPDTVTRIGSEAFSLCAKLTQVTFSKNLYELGASAFYGCTALKSAELPDSLQIVGDGVFAYCSALTDVKLSHAMHAVSEEMFLNTGVKNITIPDGIDIICEAAFSGCENLEKIVLPETVSRVEIMAFYGCKSLTDVYVMNDECDIDQTWGTICNYMSSKQDDVTKFVSSFSFRRERDPILFPVPMFEGRIHGSESAEIVKAYAEYNGYTFEAFETKNDKLFSYEIVDDFAVVTGYSRVDGIDELNIPSEIEGYPVQVLSSSLFYPANCDCPKVNIADSVRVIGDFAFFHCDVIKELKLPKNLEFIGEQAFCRCFGLTDVTIPEGTKFIDKWSFSECTGLTKVSIPGTVRVVGETAFEQCTALEEAVLGEGIHTIRNCAFSGCGKLSKAAFPEGLFSLEACAFIETALETVSLPASLHLMGNDVLSGTPWMDAQSTEKPLVLGKFLLECNGSEDIPKEVRCIAGGAFNGVQSKSQKAIEAVTIPATVSTICRAAFAGSTVKTITIEDGVGEINDFAFQYTDLETIELPESVSYVGEGAFYANANLKDIWFYHSQCEIWDAADTITTNSRSDTPVLTSEATAEVEANKDETLKFDGTIHGYSVSTADNYAKKYRCKFVPIDVYSPEVEVTDEKLGDMNEDGKLTVSDAILLSRVSVGDVTLSLSDEALAAADVDGDGLITSLDVTAVLRRIAKCE